MLNASLKPEDDFSEREFPMTMADFKRIQAIAYKKTGIKLSDHKKNMIYGRLARRMRRLKLDNFKQYCDLVESDGSSEENDFINSITTNLTAFFREPHHFDFLKDELLPTLITRNQSTRRLRIWSAGCSTGEEAYSTALVLSKINGLRHWDVKILATDLDTEVVAKGSRGVYPLDKVDSIPSEYHRYLNKKESEFQINQSVRSMISFKQLNLLGQWPMKGPFDLIFCRNVIIYFDSETQRTLFSRYATLCHDQSHLFIGHSESLHNISRDFRSLGRTIYARC